MGKDLPQQSAHVFPGTGVLRKNQVPTSKPANQGYGVFRSRNFRGEMRQIFRFDLVKDARDYAQAIRATGRRSNGLPGIRFRKLLQNGARPFEVGIAFGHGALDGRNNLLGRTTQFVCGAAQKQKILSRHTLRAATANEFDAPILAHLRTPPQKHNADLARAPDVRPAARLEIGALNLNGAKDSRALDSFANAVLRQIFRCAVAHRHGTIFENNLVCRALRAFQDFVRWLRTAQINGAQFRSQVKRNRGPAEAFLKHGRQKMLPRVLLHMIEAARPFNATVHRPPAKFAVNDMQNFLAVVPDIQHVGFAKTPQIMRLPA
jgi:hypothetical protein